MPDLHLIDGFHATPQRFLHHPASRTAILSDLHLGIESTLAQQGISFPTINFPALCRAWSSVIDRLRSDSHESRIIIAGDLFDSPNPDPAAITAARELINMLPPTIGLTILPGNHDPSLEALRDLLALPRGEIIPSTTVGGYTVIHGHQSADAHIAGQSPPQGLIVGHQHPAVILSDRVQSAKMICFATCRTRFAKADIPVIILPTFSRDPLGSNLLTDRNWILDLPRPLDTNIRIAGIVEAPNTSQVLDFGPLAGLIRAT